MTVLSHVYNIDEPVEDVISKSSLFLYSFVTSYEMVAAGGTIVAENSASPPNGFNIVYGVVADAVIIAPTVE